MKKTSKIYVAGHRGLVGSAIVRKLEAEGYKNITTRTHAELDLLKQNRVEAFFKKEKTDYVFLAAAKVGGIWGNNIYPAQFIYENLAIQSNIIHALFIPNIARSPSKKNICCQTISSQPMSLMLSLRLPG
jgi:GDP-L-fucose synthase